ncbi:fungal-specific transcription factor domain-containing protein [Xylaria castorea]|nr:fungal-specific transcription factor domain-containing protein [Xylaria castorea]
MADNGSEQQQQQQQQQQRPQQQQQQQKKPPLSCTSCRARKLKCDRQDPCRNCVRSGSECVFPARKRIQRPRKTKNAELLQRLNRLESIVGRVGLSNLEELEARVGIGGEITAADVDAHAHAHGPPVAAAEQEEEEEEEEEESSFGLYHPPLRTVEAAGDSEPHDDGNHAPCGLKGVRPPQDSTASRYLSGDFWSSLCDEVGGLRQALEQSTDSEDEDDNEESTPESFGGGGGASILTSPGMLLGTRQRGSLHAIKHPSPDHIQYLASTYFRNVDVHLKILHRPTILSALSGLAANSETASDLSPESTALFFAIYYASITSLTSTECVRSLGRPRADLATLFQAGIEQALLRADYLNNTSLETLQALTLYTCCLRSHNGSRASWALLGLPIRLAQALNIHQDGDGTHSRLTPFEAEQRRRLWWQLIVLDIRAAEDRGTGTIIARGSYDTRLPHNLDDVEFGPDTTTPLRDRPGPSDTTFGLFTAQSSGIFLWSEHVRQNMGEEGGEETVCRRARYLEAQFLRGADPEHVGSYLASVTVRLIILKMWLVMRYPLHPRDAMPWGPAVVGDDKVPPPLPTTSPDVPGSSSAAPSSSSATTKTTTAPRRAAPIVSRQSTLRTAVSIMELSEFSGPYSDRFRWWAETYVQWHPLAVTLAELCTQTEGDVVEHAWQVVEDVFPRWSDRIADAKRGSLWRPIRKLYKKAKAAREAALSTRSGKSQSQSQSQTQRHTRQTQAQTTWGPSAAPASSTADVQLSGLEPAVDYMAIDPALAADSDRIRPRLITDMIFSESSSHTLTSDSPMSYTKLASTATPNSNPTSIIRNQRHQEFLRSKNLKRSTETVDMPPPPFDINIDDIIGGEGQSITEALLAWPDMNFDVPSSFPAGNYNTAQSQAPVSAVAGTVAGDGSMLTDPALLDTTMMNWSTWDEFVLDTYANQTPKSGSGGSEGS